VGDYKPQEIEAKWQKRWAEHRSVETKRGTGRGAESETQEHGQECLATREAPGTTYYVLELCRTLRGTDAHGAHRNLHDGECGRSSEANAGFNVC